jgi:hypothetical protein
MNAVRAKPRSQSRRSPSHAPEGGDGATAGFTAPAVQMAERTSPPPLGAYYQEGPVLSLNGMANGRHNGVNGYGPPGGNGGGVQFKLAIGQPGDFYEREADAAADRVTSGGVVPAITPLRPGALSRMATAQTQAVKEEQAEEEPVQPCACEEEQWGNVEPPRVQRQAVPEEEGAEPAEVQTTPQTAGGGGGNDLGGNLSHPTAGAPLTSAVRSRLEIGLGADLSGVRLHNDTAAQQMAHAFKARAFTHGQDIYMGSGESSTDTRLMAHEATHVVQQGAAPVQRATMTEEKPPEIQRSWLGSLAAGAGAVWNVTGGALVNAAGQVIEMGAAFFWSALETVAPSFVPILRRIQQEGILGYLGGIIRETFGGVFDGLVGTPGAFDQMVNVFSDLAGRSSMILTALASGDCQPLFDAISQLKTMLEQITSDVWNGITDFFRPIGDFFSNLWQKFGAPFIDWITAVAGDVWEWLQQLGRDIWAWTQPLRDNLAAAWNWVKEQLFGSSEGGEAASGESSGGIVGWITQKAGEAWNAIKRELDPVIAPIRSFGESVVALLPLDTIRNMRDSVTGFLGNMQNMTQNLSQPQDAVENQGSLRETILPAVLRAIGGVRELIIGAGSWVSGQIGGIVQTATAMLGSIRSNSILGFLAGAISWVQEGITSLSTWAQGTVISLFTSMGDGLVYLSQFIEPVLNALQQLVNVISDLLGQIGGFITGIWNRIPACIREPLQQFIVEQILSRIPIFGQLMQIPDIFARIADTVMTILRQVFVNGDLLGAAWTFFRSLLELLGIPPELVLNIISKAATAFTDILNDPVGFFINLLHAVKQGFILFFDNIGTHLLTGVTGWLFSELSEAGIRPPADLSLGSIISFTLEVLGITVDNFFERLGTKIGRERAQRIRRVFNLATGAIRWIYRLVSEGPGAIWEEIQSQLSSLWNRVLDAVTGWLNRTIIVRATVRLLSMLDPTGIMAVVNSIIAIYNAIQSFVRYIRPILETVNTVLDGVGGIARGAIDQAAGFLESALARILPIAIGFLANQVGLSGLGRRIAEMVETVRGYVNRAIDWLIDRGIAAFNALLSGARAAVGGVREWWQARQTVREPNGTQHSLYFDPQAGGRYQLMIASNPRSVLAFLRTVREQVAPNAAQDHARATTLAERLDQEGAARASTASVTGQMSELAQVMGRLYAAILPGASFTARDGSPGNPFEIKWHKPFAPYPTINLPNNLNMAAVSNIPMLNRTQVTVPENTDMGPGGLTSTQNTIENIISAARRHRMGLYPSVPGRYTGEDARARRQAGYAAEVSFREVARTAFTPTTTTITIGVTPQYIVGENSVLGPSLYTTTFRDSAVTTSYKDILRRAGFNWADISPEHVTDLYFGGHDVYENLWPLESALNRIPTQLLNLTYGIDQDLVVSRGLTTNPTDVKLRLYEPRFANVVGRNKYFIVRIS